MEALFWISFAVIVYVYVGYPLLLAVSRWCRSLDPGDRPHTLREALAVVDEAIFQLNPGHQGPFLDELYPQRRDVRAQAFEPGHQPGRRGRILRAG